MGLKVVSRISYLVPPRRDALRFTLHATLVFSLWSLVFSLPSLAVDPSYFSTREGYSIVSSSPMITIGYVVQLFFSLVIVIGLIYITAKFLLPKIKTSTKSTFISVVDKIVIEPQVSTYIIKVKNSAWLIVISNKQVTKIDKLEGDY